MLEILEFIMFGLFLVRVQMCWNVLLNFCGIFIWGEVEDYQLMLELGIGLRSIGNGLFFLQNKAGEVMYQLGVLKVWLVFVAGMLYYVFVQEEEGVVEVLFFDGLGWIVFWDLLEDGCGIQQFQMFFYQVFLGLY